MRNYGKVSLAGLLIRVAIAVVLIIVAVIAFKAVFQVVATLLTLLVIGLGIYMVLKLIGGRTRY